MLQAFRDVSYHAWLRGSLEGITPAELRNLLRLRDRFRRGVLTHVVLHAKLEARYADRPREVKSELRKAGFRKELVLANARRLRSIIGRLEWKRVERGLERLRHVQHLRRERHRGEGRVRARRGGRACARRSSGISAATTGGSPRSPASTRRRVVAVDGDHAVIDGLARRLAAKGNTLILPLVGDLADPSPGPGLAGRRARARSTTAAAPT